MVDAGTAASDAEPGHLVFPAHLRQELIDHARAEAPDEACGILAGRGDRVERVFRARNIADQISAEKGFFRDRASGQASPGRRAVHYFMDPIDQVRIDDEITELALDTLGYYHSHTQSEARPSPTDIRLATDPTAIWVLVSLENAAQPVVRAWRIHKQDPADEAGTLVELELQDG